MGSTHQSALRQLILPLWLLLLAAPRLSGQELSAREIVQKMDTLLRGKSSYTKMKITIYNPDWSKPRVMEFYAYESTEDKKAFIRITSPPRDQGTGFLKIEYNLWMYLPATERVMKIPPSMMHQSWMGSDFSNDDLVKESSLVNDYEQKITGVETDPEQGKVFQLELLPKPSAQVVWGKILLRVREQGFVPLREQYFDEQGRLVNEMTFSQVQEIGGRTLPTVWEMHSTTKPGHRTVLELREAEFNLAIPPGTFTEKNLKTRN